MEPIQCHRSGWGVKEEQGIEGDCITHSPKEKLLEAKQGMTRGRQA